MTKACKPRASVRLPIRSPCAIRVRATERHAYDASHFVPLLLQCRGGDLCRFATLRNVGKQQCELLRSRHARLRFFHESEDVHVERHIATTASRSLRRGRRGFSFRRRSLEGSQCFVSNRPDIPKFRHKCHAVHHITFSLHRLSFRRASKLPKARLSLRVDSMPFAPGGHRSGSHPWPVRL